MLKNKFNFTSAVIRSIDLLVWHKHKHKKNKNFYSACAYSFFGCVYASSLHVFVLMLVLWAPLCV